MSDKDLEQCFSFSCKDSGVTAVDTEQVLREVHLMLLEKLLNVHGNEVLESTRLLSGVKVDASLMLRDNLKAMATRSNK